MPIILKIVAYVGFVMVAGSLIAVPLYGAGQWAIETELIPALKKYRFPKYLNRGVLIAALVGLWPFLKSLGLGSLQSMGLEKNPRRWSDLLLGIVLGVVGLSLVAGWLLVSERLALRPSISAVWFASALATAVAVAIIEEFFSVALFWGVVAASFSQNCRSGIVGFFAVLHFIKPHPSVKLWDGEIHWWTGFEVLSYSFWQFGEPRLLVGGLLTLFIVGLVLAYATLKTRSLFLALGLHGGWVFYSASRANGNDAPSATRLAGRSTSDHRIGALVGL